MVNSSPTHAEKVGKAASPTRGEDPTERGRKTAQPTQRRLGKQPPHKGEWESSQPPQRRRRSSSTTEKEAEEGHTCNCGYVETPVRSTLREGGHV